MGRSFQIPRKRPASELNGAPSTLQVCSHPLEQAGRTPQVQSVAPQGRKPLAVLQQSAQVATQPIPNSKQGEAGFQALYTASSNKRRNNKTWLDGFILFQGDSAPYTLHLFSSEGKLVTKAPYKTEIAAEDLLQVRSWDIEVCDAVSPASIHNGSCYIDAAAESAPPPVRLPAPAKLPACSAPTSRPQPRKPQAFKLEGALILDEPSEGGSPAFVPEFLARRLRPHQERGVKFLYNAVTGKNKVLDEDADGGLEFRDDHSQRAHYGAILADDMGLGKTLQVLATSWALMNAHGPTGRPIVRKMLIVSPSSVCNNWAKEIKKWLGPFHGECHRVLMPGKGAINLVNGFKAGIQWKYLVASYENVRKVSSDLKNCIDLLICDEGHRLKAKNLNSTMKALLELGCPRRVILTGTPCQNNLLEFYSMMSFVNPGLLGPPAVFQRVFVKPIEASQDTSATPEEIEVGQSRSKELQRRIACFMLRRTAAVNEKYLPKCFQYVVFCRPSAAQVAAYKEELHGGEDCNSRSERPAFNRVFNGSGIDGTKVLSIINRLRQICNHAQFSQVNTAPEQGPISFAPQKRGMTTAQGSTKLNVLRCMLAAASKLGEKVVIVSTSTQMLDAAAQVCGGLGLPTGRIDGSTPAALRQELVDQFNDTSPATGNLMKVFILSTRAGGAGLNLIGGSRLVLLDSDWNPAMDQQAMARIWRDGQKRPCHIYRLLVTGLIDEKIFQRQLFKGNLSGVVGNVSTEAGSSETSKKSNNAGSFSREELKKLFSINEDTDCDTRDTMASGGTVGKMAWKDCKDATEDEVLREAVNGASVSYAWLQAVKGQAGDDDAEDLDDCTENVIRCGIKESTVEQPLSLGETGVVGNAAEEQWLSDDDFLVDDAEVCTEGGKEDDDCNGRVQQVLDDSDSEKDVSEEKEMHALSSALLLADSDLLDDS